MGISSLYKNFSEAEGSEHIASEFAILKIQEIIRMFNISSVLEVGLGIGSISGIILQTTENKNLVYSGTEDNIFCLKNLPLNLGVNFKRLKIYRNLQCAPKNKYDLIIIDGKDPDLIRVEGLVSDRGILAIEGDRMPQQELLLELFPNHSYVHCISLSKNKTYSPFKSAHWQGGLKVICINPNLKQRIWLVKEKINTKVKYIYRNFGRITKFSRTQIK